MLKNIEVNDGEDSKPTGGGVGSNGGAAVIANVLDATAVLISTDNSAHTTTTETFAASNIVQDIADCIMPVPQQLTVQYIQLIKRAASFVLDRQLPDIVLETGALNSTPSGGFPEKDEDTIVPTEPTPPGAPSNANEKLRSELSLRRNYVFEFKQQLESFVSRAKNAGYAPQINPFSLISFINSKRNFQQVLPITEEKLQEIKTVITNYKALMKLYSEGKLNLDSNNYAAQFSSADISMSGLGSTGDSSIDLAKLLPDMDAIKLKNERDRLSVFDFSKRKPRILFTCSYEPSSKFEGIIVCWKKMRDASGYKIYRKNELTLENKQVKIDADQAAASSKSLSDYVKTWAMSFYDTIPADSVISYLDNDAPKDQYFTYTVKAYQIENKNIGSIFSTQVLPVYLTANQRKEIKSEMTKTGQSIYPFLAKKILGNADLDWVLAAVNVRESINRKDTRTNTRSYSYLTANHEFISTASDNNLLVKPTSVNSVYDRINECMSKFGVMQTIKEVLQETGVLFYFDGKDQKGNNALADSDSSLDDSSVVSHVISAIDEESATLDLSVLSANMPFLIRRDSINVSSGDPKFLAAPEEVSLDFVKQNNVDVRNASPGVFDTTIVDLTTPEGIGKLLRAIRVFADLEVAEPQSEVTVQIVDKTAEVVSVQTENPPYDASTDNEVDPTQFDTRVDRSTEDLGAPRPPPKGTTNGD